MFFSLKFSFVSCRAFVFMFPHQRRATKKTQGQMPWVYESNPYYNTAFCKKSYFCTWQSAIFFLIPSSRMPRIITLIGRSTKPYAVVMKNVFIITHNLFSVTSSSDSKKITLYSGNVNRQNEWLFFSYCIYFCTFFMLYMKKQQKRQMSI